MTKSKLLLCFWLGSFLGYVVHDVAQTQLAAQRNAPMIGVEPFPSTMEMPLTYTGAEVGVRVIGHGTDGARGHLVVRINDEWHRVTLLP